MQLYQYRGRVERLHQILMILRADTWLYNSTIKDEVEEELKVWEVKLKEQEQKCFVKNLNYPTKD